LNRMGHAREALARPRIRSSRLAITSGAATACQPVRRHFSVPECVVPGRVAGPLHRTPDHWQGRWNDILSSP